MFSYAFKQPLWQGHYIPKGLLSTSWKSLLLSLWYRFAKIFMTSAYVLCETFPGKMQHIFIWVFQGQTENNQSKLVESFSFIGVSYRTIGKELLTRSQETQSHLLSYNDKQAFEKNYYYWILEAHLTSVSIFIG